ncbi:MAG: hypothetical protein AAF386_03980 [Pseudomonadota bacterium]
MRFMHLIFLILFGLGCLFVYVVKQAGDAMVCGHRGAEGCILPDGDVWISSLGIDVSGFDLQTCTTAIEIVAANHRQPASYVRRVSSRRGAPKALDHIPTAKIRCIFKSTAGMSPARAYVQVGTDIPHYEDHSRFAFHMGQAVADQLGKQRRGSLFQTAPMEPQPWPMLFGPFQIHATGGKVVALPGFEPGT